MKDYPLEYYEFFVKFNEDDYYTCHDLLEEIWLIETDNFFLKGLLQMTVALYHYGYGNVKGARAMMGAAKRYLQPYRPHYWSLDVEYVLHFVEKCLAIIPADIDRVSFEESKRLPVLPDLVLYME
ncbi:DUF309 domain-containing protein [Ectobacillus polymachus]|uniref:DUF309 domain-containing protein n=1 Tax=Ectobacillus polymachus TaxID=1508806 RepID=UPI003A873180